MHEKLSLDYKTIQHHIKVLTGGNIITANEGSRYGSMYFISPLLEKNMYLYEEISAKIGKKQIKGKAKK
jgi:DNA-binding transcriptional ArsR family regulator